MTPGANMEQFSPRFDAFRRDIKNIRRSSVKVCQHLYIQSLFTLELLLFNCYYSFFSDFSSLVECNKYHRIFCLTQKWVFLTQMFKNNILNVIFLVVLVKTANLPRKTLHHVSFYIKIDLFLD